MCAEDVSLYRGGVCSGPALLKCVRCASEQYGWMASAALTSGLNVMRHFRGKVDRYIANSRSVADVSKEVVPGM